MKHTFLVTVEANSPEQAHVDVMHALETSLGDERFRELVRLDGVIQERFHVRGMALKNFRDRYGSECCLQESSLATEAAIWFGTSNADPQVRADGPGWKPVPFPEGTLFNTRMHLTIPMVKALLPHLQGFVITGDLSQPVTEYIRNENTELVAKLNEIKMLVEQGSFRSLEKMFEEDEKIKEFLKESE